MKNRRLGVIGLFALLLVGCVSVETPVSPSLSGMPSLEKVSKGMSVREVMEILGKEIVVGTPAHTIKNPYRYENFKVKGRTLEVLYYFTHVQQTDAVISDDELTPLVFENNQLIGQGWDFLNEIKN